MRAAKRVRGGAPFTCLSSMAQNQSISHFSGLSVVVSGSASRSPLSPRPPPLESTAPYHCLVEPGADAWAGLLFPVVSNAPPEVVGDAQVALQVVYHARYRLTINWDQFGVHKHQENRQDSQGDRTSGQFGSTVTLNKVCTRTAAISLRPISHASQRQLCLDWAEGRWGQSLAPTGPEVRRHAAALPQLIGRSLLPTVK